MKQLNRIFFFFSVILGLVSAVPQADTFHLVDPKIVPSFGDSISAWAFDILADIPESNSTIKFALETNDDLISQDATFLVSNGHGHIEKRDQLGSGLYLTKGATWIKRRASDRWEEAGWARLAVSQTEEGVVVDGTFTLFLSQYEIQLEGSDGSTMIASRHTSDFLVGNRTSESMCATAEDSITKRQFGITNAWANNLESTIGDTDGCPDTRRVANIGIMTDCTYTASFNSSESARRYILNMVNTASVVFENSFNVSLSIQNLTISDEQCPTSTSQLTAWNIPCSSGDMNSRLQDFSTWRSSFSDTNAYWTLLTGCSTNGGEVGVSWIGALCNSGSGSSGSSNGGASANVVARTSSEWQVFAHESAHTFGAVHDCESSSCASGSSQCCPLSSNTCDAGGQYIMNPVSGPGITRFSPCTIGNVCSRMGSGQVDARCLVDSNGNNGTTGQCGNGIVESGEACDCGNGACDEQETRCCDSVTCQRRGGNECRSDTRGGTDSGRGSTPGSGQSNRDSLSSWVDDHLQLVIGLAAGIGGVLLLLVLGCIICSCRRRTSPKIPIR